MFNTISNFNRKGEKYGDVHFISFLGAVLSRFAYFNDNNFLKKYNSIMGPIIQPKILESINSVPQTNLPLLLDDQTLFGLNKSPQDIFANYEYQYKGKNYIDFLKLNMPQNINIINGDTQGNISSPLQGQPPGPNDVKYISIGWSNYGEIYVVADKRMPNMLFLIFRGTYSAKTAALYSKPTSAVPLTTCQNSSGNPEQFLYGIFKATSEMIHTIIETMRFLATTFLQASEPNSVKIFTTGHSLGGAMCSIFAYLWIGIKKTAPYNASPYNVLADNIICVSLGAPRCMNTLVANKFCNFVKQNNILFLRITTNGDPVPALPPKNPLFPKFSFQHPCSDDATMRNVVSEACKSQLIMRPSPNVNYNGDLDCLNYKGRIYAVNPLSHTIYLDIIYTKAVDILRFFKGMVTAQEVARGPNKSTLCRLIMGNGNDYKAIFFDVNNSRITPSNLDAMMEIELTKVEPNEVAQFTQQQQTAGGWLSSMFKPAPVAAPMNTPVPTAQTQALQKPNQVSSPINTPQTRGTFKIGGPVAEDRKMTLETFNSLIEQMVALQGNLCPLQGNIFNPFTNQTKTMPDLSCLGVKIGGKHNKSKKRRQKNKKNKRTQKHKKTCKKT